MNGMQKLSKILEAEVYKPDMQAHAAFDAIRPGSRVTIVNRFHQEHSGKAVMRGPHGWVLNMGGAHGTPAIATPDNIVRVKG